MRALTSVKTPMINRIMIKMLIEKNMTAARNISVSEGMVARTQARKIILITREKKAKMILPALRSWQPQQHRSG